jgi:hypothetical protein
MNRLKQLFSRRTLYGDLSEEIWGHLEERIEKGKMPRYAWNKSD